MARWGRFSERWSLEYVVICGIALVYRAATSLHPYSGEGTPPFFGDYEAQRHWMEITQALPPRLWYRECPSNLLSYWGLDYPPLSAYASYLAGAILGCIEPAAVRLVSSRGFESATSRAAMRASVLAADAFILFPAIIASVSAPWRRAEGRSMPPGWLLAFVLSLPALIIIDHGHFQYNGVSLGLFVASVTAMSHGMFAGGASLFCLSVYFKQMGLYLAPSVAAYLLSILFHQGSLASTVIFALKVAAAIIATTAIVFAPWIFPRFDVIHVLQRLFPVARGLFEDKVANFWCSLSVIIKVSTFLDKPTLFKLCAVCTVVASLPFCIAVAARPSPRQLLLSCGGCSLAAYLFSYQVHEKQILIPLLPIALLADSIPAIATHMSLASVFSLYPLMAREGLTLAYIALIIIHVLVADATLVPDRLGKSRQWRYFTKCSFAFALCLHGAPMFGPNIPSKPDLYTVLMTCYACAHFCLIYTALLYYSFAEEKGSQLEVTTDLSTKSKYD